MTLAVLGVIKTARICIVAVVLALTGAVVGDHLPVPVVEAFLEFLQEILVQLEVLVTAAQSHLVRL